MKMKLVNLIMVMAMVTMAGCEKFLDEKSDAKLVVPNDLSSLQALLDLYGSVNNSDAGEGEVAANDYYLTEDVWSALSNEEDRRAYLWQPDHATLENRGWARLYRYVYWANVVLDGLKSIERNDLNKNAWDNIKGQAKFLRARGFLALVAIWAMPYDALSASDDLGIPLRLDPDFNIRSTRATVQETYDQIIRDLVEAAELLPVASEHVLRASKPAALALMARTYLFMRDYDSCFRASDASLKLKNDLMDYNKIDIGLAYPIPIFNPEVIHHSTMPPVTNPILAINRALVDSTLYESYQANDLRKAVFFRGNGNGTYSMRGNYSGTSSLFSGLSTNEVYLMRSESRIRLGDIEGGLADLNHLLRHRYSDGSPYTRLTANSQQEVLSIVLEERRKELLFRGLRFPDVKRLNKEGATIHFRRLLADTEHILPPNDPRFALSIPEGVLELAPDVLQNPR